MAKRKHQVLIEDGNVPEDVASLLLDSSLYSRYKNFKAYLDEEKIPYEPADLRRLVALIERQIQDQVLAIAHLQYYLMNLTGDWSDAGEQQVKISFCRALLGVGSEIQLTEAHASEFYSLVDAAVYTYGFEGLTGDTGKSLFETKVISMLGQQYKADPGPRITAVLQFLGSKCVLISRPFWRGFAYIFGEAVFRTKEEYNIYYMLKERIRSGSYVMSNVATVSARNICMREEALSTVFYQKWVQAFEPRRIFHYGPNADEFSRMSMAIKQRTLALFGAKSVDDLETAKKMFLADMRETVLYHELAHGITKDYLFPYEKMAIAQGIDSYHKISTYEGLIEFLSDFAPPTHQLHGPMWNMTEVAKTDQKRAERMFYMYFSDVFFYDTEDEHMYDYSDMMCLILIRYVKPGLDVDFSKMSADMQYRGLENEGPTSLFEKLAKVYVDDTEAIKEAVKLVKYQMSEERDFNFVKQFWLGETKKYFKFATDTDTAFLSSFWVNVFSYIEHFSKTDGPKILAMLQKKSKTVVAKVMVLSAGRQKAESYQFNVRTYLIDRFKSVGLFSE